MCGIVGYIGKQQALPILLEGLGKLEYRGYDSSGVAVIDDHQLQTEKAKGKLNHLIEKIGTKPLDGHIGIGHTRWATHGKPSDENAHPHLSPNGKFAVVHNGIVENYLQIKEAYLKDHTFCSETDTEVIAHLLELFYDGSFEEAVRQMLNVIEGAYALVMICADEPDKIIACRKASPMVLGLGQGENFIASDVPALLAHTRQCMYIEPNELCIITAEEIIVKTPSGERIAKEVHTIEWDAQSAEKGGFEHFMLKEIHEQPEAFRRTLSGRIQNQQVIFSEFQLTSDLVANWRKIYIVACGSAYHAGIVGQYVIEKLARVSVRVELASEFRYRDPILDPDGLVIVISQSGETADTLAALREAKQRGTKTLAIVNVVGSSIAREADKVFYTLAGPEIAVATTKAYSAQLIACYAIAVEFGRCRQTVSDVDYKRYLEELAVLPTKINKIIEDKERLQWFAAKHANAKDIFFIGRGIDYAVCLEGSLKLKEISYIHSEAYAAGELKHGTISLIEDGTLVVSVLTQPELYEKTLSNLVEVKSRGAYCMGLTTVGNYKIEDTAEFVTYIPQIEPCFAASLAVVPLQLLSYYISLARGLDVDKPRNLAKSVTVE